MKNLILFVVLFTNFQGFSQSSDSDLIFTRKRNEKTVIDTIKNKEAMRMYNSLMKGVIPKESFESIRNKKGQLIIKKLNPPNGNVFKQTYLTYKYDSIGYLIEEAYFNKDSSYQAGYSDIAIYQHKNDSNGNQIETRYLGEKKELIRMEFVGPAIVKRKFNNHGLQTEESFYDENEKSLMDFHKVIWKYNSEGKLISKTSYNSKGEEI